MKKLSFQITKPTIPTLIRRLLLSWLCAVTLSYCILPFKLKALHDATVLEHTHWTGVLVFGVLFYLIFGIVGQYKNTLKAERWLFVAAFFLLSCTALPASFSLAFLLLCVLILGLLIIYACLGWDQGQCIPISTHSNGRIYKWILALLAITFVAFVSVWTVARVLSFCAPTYDFGIFSQMFYSMKTTGLPMTTLERDGLLSHFHVHASPIYYLLLPFYWIAPTPETLQILQACILASAVIPLWLICRHKGLSPVVSLLLCSLLLLYPAYSGGTSYDIHENAFLTPLLLWMLLFLEKRKYIGVFLFAVLILMVKEDAAVYVAVISLYVLLKTLLYPQKDKRRDYLAGCGLLSISLIWFIGVTTFLTTVGDGVMAYRYQNLMTRNSTSLLSVVLSVIKCPMKALYECVDAEKSSFIILTMLPLLGLPFATRHYERLLLLIPYLLVNLVSDYQYQHSIFFQYTFGSTACLIYLCAINLSDFQSSRRTLQTTVLCVLIASCLWAVQVLPKSMVYPRLYANNNAHYQQIQAALDTIPEDATVSASTFYTTRLSQRDTLFDVKYAQLDHVLSTEYVALDMVNPTSYTLYATEETDGFENLVSILESNHYKLYHELEDTLVIYKKE